MSPAAIPMSYACDDQDTALRERKATESCPRHYAVGRFETLRSVTLLDLTAIPPVPGLFDSIPGGSEFHPRKMLGLVDVCLNNDFRVQITPDRRRAAQLRKENPIRLWCSPRPSATSADKKVFSATLRVLRGQKGVLRDPPRPPRTKRCSPRPSASSADKKVFSATLRDLRGQKGVLRDPPRPPRTKRCSPRPSASSADKKVFFATLRVTSRINWFCLFQHSSEKHP